MTIDYSLLCNQAFINGLTAFLEYSAPNSLRSQQKEGLMVRRRLQKENFEKRCIQRWAISELVDSIVKNPHEPVEDTTYKLALKLYSFEKTAHSESMKKVFRIAAEFIDDEVIGLFRTREGMYP